MDQRLASSPLDDSTLAERALETPSVLEAGSGFEPLSPGNEPGKETGLLHPAANFS